MFINDKSKAFIQQITLLTLPDTPIISLKDTIINSSITKISGSFIPCSAILRASYREVQKSKCKRYKHAAVIAKGNKIIYTACNIQRKTHPKGSGPYGTVHAEVRAIIGAKRLFDDLSNFKIFIIRINSAGQIKAAKPCRDCMSFIVKEGLDSAWTDELVSYDNFTDEAKEKLFRTYGYALNVRKCE